MLFLYEMLKEFRGCLTIVLCWIDAGKKAGCAADLEFGVVDLDEDYVVEAISCSRFEEGDALATGTCSEKVSERCAFFDWFMGFIAAKKRLDSVYI